MFEQHSHVIAAIVDALGDDHHLYVVGGAVRDEMLELPVKDLDFATELLPQDVYARLCEAGGSSLGSSAWISSVFDVGMEHGTVGCIVSTDTSEMPVEITTMRSECYPHGDRRRPEVVFCDDILEDLSRRDFTINAMAYDVVAEHLVDPFHGRTHLSAGIIMAVGNPVDRFVEDPLRMLRAVRFMSKYGFSISNETMAAMSHCSDLIELLSVERVFSELCKILLSPAVFQAFLVMLHTDMLRYVVPELVLLVGVEQPKDWHDHDVFMHTLYALHAFSSAEADDLYMALALMLHDTGKPYVQTYVDGVPKFHGHEDRSRDIALAFLERMNASNDIKDAVTHLVGNHMRAHRVDPYDRRSVRRFIRKTDLPSGEEDFLVRAEDLVLHALYDEMGAKESRTQGAIEQAYLAIKAIIAERSVLPDIRVDLCPLKGERIMELLNVAPGPIIGSAKKHLADLVVDGTLNPADQLACESSLMVWFFEYQEGATSK